VSEMAKSDCWELGEVVWFNKERRFGFAKDGEGKEIFFHFNDGRFVKVAENREVIFTSPAIELFGRRIPLDDPKPGDCILFVRTRGSKGRPKASPWCFDDMYLEEQTRYDEDQKPCPLCMHRMGEHSGGCLCMIANCHCGDEAYEHEDDEPQQVWFTESPGGHYGYE